MPVLTGLKWGDSLAEGTSGGVVTWSVVGAGVGGVRDDFGLGPNPMTSDETVAARDVVDYNVAAVFREAFRSWEQHADITFVQVKDDGRDIGVGRVGEIRLAFGEIDGSSGDTLGLGFFPSGGAIAGDILFDKDETNFYSDPDNLLAVAAHEIGHALGLDHITGVPALMNPIIGVTDEPLADDIEGISQIYGEDQGRRGETLRLDTQTKDVELLQNAPELRVVGTGAANEIIGAGAAEILVGRRGADDLMGRGGADTLMGGGGADDLFGGARGDELRGGAGRDDLVGGAGFDTLIGGGGDDDLRGQGGRDDLRGGGGRDDLLGGALADRLEGGAGRDELTGGGGGDR
ncbi:MAG: matrixin family metalloprotease, partial [Pseudomonadota bacterium]